MRIAVGNDHAGVELKWTLMQHLADLGVEAENLGVDSEESVDYPDVAATVGEAVSSGEYDLGLLICGTGIGVCLAANKVRGVRAAPCCFEYHARMAREHNHANICCLGARVVGPELAKSIVTAFIRTPVSDAERHLRRRDKVMALEQQ
ncbi:MAG: ribose 5-phosphate isomerase B [Armatimonadota bacterium]|nr:ribose 5-phosphate isomerase B [Armatimonadota bacterium]